MEETSTDMEALARRAMACQKWRWMRGMVDTEGRTVLIVGKDGQPAVWAWERVTSDGTGWQWGVYHNGNPHPCLPDLTDPATLGCLLALVREAWGDPHACVMKGAFTGWRVHAGLGKPVQDWEPRDNHPTEAGALVLALEAAPK